MDHHFVPFSLHHLFVGMPNKPVFLQVIAWGWTAFR